MKKKIYLLLTILSVTFLTSCLLALQFTQTANRKEYTFDEEQIEFIGFKNTHTDMGNPIENVNFLKDFGKELERTHIAIDRTNFYLGGYSLLDMGKYKSRKRYVSFIDVSEHSLTYDNNYGLRPKLVKAGWCVFGGAVGAGVSLPIVGAPAWTIWIPLIGGPLTTVIMVAVGSTSNKSLLEFNGEYMIYIYDMQSKETVVELPVRVNDKTAHKGQYYKQYGNYGGNTDETKTAISEYYGTILFNAFMEEYQKAYGIIKTNK